MRIEPGDIVIWPPNTSQNQGSQEKYRFGHVELGCDLRFRRDRDLYLAIPEGSIEAATFWPLNPHKEATVPDDCLIYRSVASPQDRRIVMDMAFAACRGILVDMASKPNDWEVVIAENKSLGKAQLPSYSLPWKQIFFGSESQRKSNVTHALRERHLRKADGFIDSYLKLTKEVGEFECKKVGFNNEEFFPSTSILNEYYCSEFAVIAAQLAAVTAVKKQYPNLRTNDDLIDQAINHPLWINLRPKIATPSVLMNWLGKSTNWRLLGRKRAIDQLGGRKDKKGRNALYEAVREGLRHYTSNIRTSWHITSSIASDRARVALAAYLKNDEKAEAVASTSDADGLELRALVSQILGIGINSAFMYKSEADIKVLQKAQAQRFNFGRERVLPKSRLYRCLAQAILQGVPNQFNIGQIERRYLDESFKKAPQPEISQPSDMPAPTSTQNLAQNQHQRLVEFLNANPSDPRRRGY